MRNTNAVTVLQSDGSDLIIHPGDVLWRNCESIYRSPGSTIKINSSVIAVMYLGINSINNAQLIFSTFSVICDKLERNGYKYNIFTEEGHRIRTNLNTLKAAIRKMKDLYRADHIYMSNKKYAMYQELFVTSKARLSRMQLEKSGLRITDMRQWPMWSIAVWGKNVLGAKFCASAFRDNASLITHLRKIMSAKSPNKKTRIHDYINATYYRENGSMLTAAYSPSSGKIKVNLHYDYGYVAKLMDAVTNPHQSDRDVWKILEHISENILDHTDGDTSEHT